MPPVLRDHRASGVHSLTQSNRGPTTVEPGGQEHAKKVISLGNGGNPRHADSKPPDGDFAERKLDSCPSELLLSRFCLQGGSVSHWALL